MTETTDIITKESTDIGDVIKIEQSASIEQIIAKLCETKNIEMLTEYQNVPPLVKLKVIAELYRKEGLTTPADAIELWLKDFSIRNVSKDRQGRTELKEITTASIKQKQQSTIDKLLGKTDETEIK
jgi:hypothetical protein